MHAKGTCAEGFVDFNEILDVIYEQEPSDSATIHQAHNYAVLRYCVVYPIVAVEAIKT